MGAYTLPVADLSERDLEAWRALAARAAEPNPFFEPSFVLPAARHLRAPRLSLLVVADGDRWLACLPVVSRSHWRRFPARWLTTWRHPYCYLGTPLVDRDRCEGAIADLVTALHESARWRLVALELCRSDGPVGRALKAALAERSQSRVVFESFERAVLFRRPEPTYLDSTLRPSRRKELRRLRRRLGEQLQGELEVRDLAGGSRGADDFLRLEASGWKGREATALASNGEHTSFFREICESWGEDGRVQLLALGTDERPVAMQCNILADDALFCFKVAYDEDLARFSPGFQLEVDAVSAFHERSGVAVMDSCAEPDNALVNRLWPDRRPLVTFVIPGRGGGSRLLLASLRLSVALRKRLRRAG